MGGSILSRQALRSEGIGFCHLRSEGSEFCIFDLEGMWLLDEVRPYPTIFGDVPSYWATFGHIAPHYGQIWSNITQRGRIFPITH